MAAGTRPFHPGELQVQRRIGVTEDAARLEGMLATANLDGRPARFLAERTFAALTARDEAGRLWTIPLVGAPGFLHGSGVTLDIDASARGPLRRVAEGSPAGLITLDFAGRRRIRVNGTVASAGPDGLRVAVHEAYGNCPSYIQAREIEMTAGEESVAPSDAMALDVTDRALIEAADTFFLGSVHPDRDADTSHKGGRPGFVRTDEDGSIWWPDYAGNNMFNSLGNLTDNPEAALLFLDFATGAALHLSGTAHIEWVERGAAGDDNDTGRRIRFRPERVIRSTVPLRGGAPDPSPTNPELRAS